MACGPWSLVWPVSNESIVPTNDSVIVCWQWHSFAALGTTNTIAIFQSYVSTHQLSQYSHVTIGWVFSVYTFLAYFCGVYIGPLFDKFGPRWLIVAGTLAMTGGFMLLSICRGKFMAPDLYTQWVDSNTQDDWAISKGCMVECGQNWRTLPSSSLLLKMDKRDEGFKFWTDHDS